MKSQITIKKIQDLLLNGLQPKYVDDETSRRMWWASLEVIQKEYLSHNYQKGGIWVASPLPALNEEKYFNQLNISDNSENITEKHTPLESIMIFGIIFIMIIVFFIISKSLTPA